MEHESGQEKKKPCYTVQMAQKKKMADREHREQIILSCKDKTWRVRCKITETAKVKHKTL